MDSYGTLRLAAKNSESAIITRICEDFNLTPVLARAYYEQMAKYFAEYGQVAILANLGSSGRREVKVRRPTNQAHRQGGLLSCADISLIAGYSEASVSATAIALRVHGHVEVSTLGQKMSPLLGLLF